MNDPLSEALERIAVAPTVRQRRNMARAIVAALAHPQARRAMNLANALAATLEHSDEWPARPVEVTLNTGGIRDADTAGLVAVAAYAAGLCRVRQGTWVVAGQDAREGLPVPVMLDVCDLLEVADAA